MTGFGIGPIWRALVRNRATYVAVVLQIAIGYAIVGQSYGLARVFIDTAHMPIGWDEENVLVLTAERYEPNGDATGLRARDLAGLRALPDVDAAEVVLNPPQSRRDVPDVLATADGHRALVWTLAGGPRFAEALGARLVAGRFPTVADLEVLREGGPIAVVMSEPLVAELWGDGDPARAVGRLLEAPTRGRPVRVVGVIARALGPAPFVPRPEQTILFAVEPPAGRRATFVLHARPGRAGEVMAGARAALQANDPDRLVEARSLGAHRARTVRNAYGAPRIIWTVNAIVVGVVLFGSLGMASFLVTERTRQIGIRRALGSRRSDVVGYFLVENFLLTAVGLVAGLPLNHILFRLLRHLGSDIQPAPWFLLASAAVFWAVGLLAALVPALRAARIPPVVASKGADR